MSDPTDDAPGEPAGSSDRAAVLAANSAFYDAFEHGDLDAMAALWERSDRPACTHPGWPRLDGWESIVRSWAGLFGNGQHLQFILTGIRVEVVGDAAVVHVDENIVGQGVGGTVSAVNLFARQDDGSWRMIGHHGCPVTPTTA